MSFHVISTWLVVTAINMVWETLHKLVVVHHCTIEVFDQTWKFVFFKRSGSLGRSSRYYLLLMCSFQTRSFVVKISSFRGLSLKVTFTVFWLMNVLQGACLQSHPYC